MQNVGVFRRCWQNFC